MASPTPTHSRAPGRARPLMECHQFLLAVGAGWLGPLCKRLEKLQIPADGEWGAVGPGTLSRDPAMRQGEDALPVPRGGHRLTQCPSLVQLRSLPQGHAQTLTRRKKKTKQTKTTRAESCLRNGPIWS